jgi:predicted MFS family arabinose efflux permease
MQHEPIRASEWHDGWKLVLAGALGSGTGVVLLFFTFSLFTLPVLADIGGTRSQLASMQALVVAGALSAPIFGRLLDRVGFRPVFFASMAIVVATECWLALMVHSLFGFGVCVFILGFFGLGTTALAVTRPINAHFDRHRGRALGLVAAGVTVATMSVPPLLAAIVAAYGWRSAVLVIAALGAFVGTPAIALLIPPRKAADRIPPEAQARKSDWSFLRTRDFWLMALSLMMMSMAGAGFIGHLSPMIQDKGVSAATAAAALSFYAVGQLVGRVTGGWLLDRFDPRVMAIWTCNGFVPVTYLTMPPWLRMRAG